MQYIKFETRGIVKIHVFDKIPIFLGVRTRIHISLFMRNTFGTSIRPFLETKSNYTMNYISHFSHNRF